LQQQRNGGTLTDVQSLIGKTREHNCTNSSTEILTNHNSRSRSMLENEMRKERWRPEVESHANWSERSDQDTQIGLSDVNDARGHGGEERLSKKN
jgi:hypothetical protein